ncbi:hypothetical protein SRHO_G00028290 [Serrasalmus rhombeus]
MQLDQPQLEDSAIQACNRRLAEKQLGCLPTRPVNGGSPTHHPAANARTPEQHQQRFWMLTLHEFDQPFVFAQQLRDSCRR